MNKVSFLTVSILISLTSISLVGCSSTDINDEISSEVQPETEIDIEKVDESTEIYSIEKNKIKVPPQG